MLLNDLIRKFSSNGSVGNYNTKIVNNLLIFINKIYGTNLINLNLLEDKFRQYSWYIDKSNGELYNILLNINNNEYETNLRDNNNLLQDIRKENYKELRLNLNKLSRSSFLRSGHMYKFSLDSKLGREHFSIDNIVLENKKAKIKRKRLSKEDYIRRVRSKSEDYNNKWLQMVSASKVRNYLLNDPLLDWLNEFNITSIYDNPKDRISNTAGSVKFDNTDEFTKYIMNQGIKFELEVYKLLKRKYNIVKVAESYEARSEEKFKKTIKLMKDGIDILYQPVLHDFKNKIYGCPDLLIRSDKINDIFEYEVVTDEEKFKKSKKLNTDYHYLIVDIKHSTLHMNVDGKTLRNNGSIPAYKGQIYVYNMALNQIQGYNPPCGYILGKKWFFVKSKVLCSGNDFMKKLGEINYQTVDNKYVDQTKEALKWIRDVRENGQEWSLLPFPSKKELYPNMKNERDGQCRELKNQLNKNISEITSVWNCGVNKRKIAHDKRIYSWKDKKCLSKNMGFKDSKTSRTIDAILKINRQNKILIDIGTLKKERLLKDDNNFEFFLDYETMNSNLGKCTIDNDIIGYSDNQFIFLIGIGWEENNEWKFKEFLARTNNKEGELNMIKEFWDFVNKKSGSKNPLFYHWTKAEVSSYDKLRKRHEDSFPDKRFYDLYDLFRKNNIVVKDSLGFKLKSIAKAMYKNKLINTSWNSSNPCSNGLKAMLLAYILYEDIKIVDSTEPVIKDIIHYNEVDCKVLWEILRYLRSLDLN